MPPYNQFEYFEISHRDLELGVFLKSIDDILHGQVSTLRFASMYTQCYRLCYNIYIYNYSDSMCTSIKSKVDQHIHSLLNEHVMKGYTEDKQVSGLPEIWNQLSQICVCIL